MVPKISLKEETYEKTALDRREPKIRLYSIDDEEEKDCEALKLFIEQHKRLFKHLYTKYANSGYSHKIKNSFDNLKVGSISIAELIKMFKEHDLTFLSANDISSFIKLINLKFFNKRNTKTLNYEGFINFFVQAAIHLFSKDNEGLYMTPLVFLKLLIEQFRKATKTKGESTLLYDNSDATVLADKELIKELTDYVSNNPFYPLPNGYKKIEQKHQKNRYIIPNYINIAENTRIAIEILDDILYNALNIHILEPITTYEYKTKVIPVIGKPNQRTPYYTSPSNTKAKELEPQKRTASLKKLTKRNLSVTIKAAEEGKDKELVKEVLGVEGEIADPVEDSKSKSMDKRDLMFKKLADQKIEEEKKRKLEEDKKEQKRRARAALLKDSLSEHKREQLAREQEAFVNVYLVLY